MVALLGLKRRYDSGSAAAAAAPGVGQQQQDGFGGGPTKKDYSTRSVLRASLLSEEDAEEAEVEERQRSVRPDVDVDGGDQEEYQHKKRRSNDGSASDVTSTLASAAQQEDDIKHQVVEAPPLKKKKDAKSSSSEILPGGDGVTGGVKSTVDQATTDTSEEVRRQRAIFYRQAYRMTPDHFWRLHHLLLPHMKDVHSRSEVDVPAVTSSTTSSTATQAIDQKDASFRLSASLRHFAGGDSESDHGIAFSVLDECIWEVVGSVHACRDLDLEYPADHNLQNEIAACLGFLKSDVGVMSCAGCVGSMLVWTDEPDVEAAYYYSRNKGRYGLHVQGVCDHEGRFLDVSVRPGSASDVAAFEESSMFEKTTAEGFLAEGLALFGGENYSQCPSVVTPIPRPCVDGQDGSGPSRKYAQSFNFIQKQLSSLSDVAFTSLIQRWGLLRRALPSCIGPDRQRSLVLALCKLHNFCLADTEPMLSSLTKDLVHSLGKGPLFVSDISSCTLLNCGNSEGDEEHLASALQPKQGSAKVAEEKLLAILEEKARSLEGCLLGSQGVNYTVNLQATARLH